jgi:Base plate wedge protein 53
MVQYLTSSPYFTTELNGEHLDTWRARIIPKEADDIVYTIKPQHALRPDLLAYDLYGDANLWWVFAVRNPNTIEDPVYDFQTGVTIFLPKSTTLKKALGL